MSACQCVYVCTGLFTVNLSDWAKMVGVNKHTAYRWWRDGTLFVPHTSRRPAHPGRYSHGQSAARPHGALRASVK